MATAARQWLLTAHDGADAAALDRRLAARQMHLDRAFQGKKGTHSAAVNPSRKRACALTCSVDGQVLMGGAMLDEASGRMIGSTMVIVADSREAAEAWVRGAWSSPFRCACPESCA